MAVRGRWAWLPRGPAGLGPPSPSRSSSHLRDKGPPREPACQLGFAPLVVITLTLSTCVGGNAPLLVSGTQRGCRETQPRQPREGRQGVWLYPASGAPAQSLRTASGRHLGSGFPPRGPSLPPALWHASSPTPTLGKTGIWWLQQSLGPHAGA